VELVSKACGMLDPIGIYLPRAAHGVAQHQGRGRAPERDSGPLASSDVDSIVDGLIVSTIDHEVSATTKMMISAAADVNVADGVPNVPKLRGMSVMFGKSVYIRLIDEIYLMTNHTEVGPGKGGMKNRLWDR